MASRLRSGSVSQYVKYRKGTRYRMLSSGRLEVKESGCRSSARRAYPALAPCATRLTLARGPAGPGAGRGRSAARAPGVATPQHYQPPRTELFRPRRCIVYRHIMSALDTGHDHDPSAARTQMFYV